MHIRSFARIDNNTIIVFRKDKNNNVCEKSIICKNDEKYDYIDYINGNTFIGQTSDTDELYTKYKFSPDVAFTWPIVKIKIDF